MKRFALVALVVLTIAIIAVLVAGSMLSHPVQCAIGAPPPGATAVQFASNSGAQIHGWWLDANAHRGVVILLPGVRANRLSMLDRARFLHAAGYTAFLIDLQATGESRGNAITFGWRERHDVIAAVAFARSRAPGQRVAIIGSSLGGAAALLATPPLRVDAMVLEAVYPSIDRAIENRLRMRIGSASRLVAPLLLWQLRPRLGVGADALKPIDHIARVGCPLLVISGADDEHTTAADTRALFAAGHEPKELWLVPNAKHVDLHRARRAEYESRVLRFLDANLPHSAFPPAR